MKKLRIYVAGPMRGIPEFNQHAFNKATAALRHLGHEVFSPVESTTAIYGDIYTGNRDGNEEAAGVDGRVVFFADVEYIVKHATAVAMLPGWEKSSGATAEHALAKALGHTIVYLCATPHGIYVPPNVDYVEYEQEVARAA